MSFKHSLQVAAACALPLSLAACGSSSSNDEPTIIPEGPHYGYVVSGVTLPKTSTDATPLGLDLGSMTSSKPDGSNDNKLGRLIGTLASPLVGLPLQKTVDTAVQHGDVILLIDVQTEDLQNSKAAGFGVKIGMTPSPAACTDPNDLTTCGRHLDGHGSFQLSPSSPADAGVGGTITSGAFDGGPGNVALQVALGSTTPITLNLVRARVRATIKTDGTLTATVGGLVTQDELMTQIGPVLQAQVMSLITTECTGGSGMCNCPADSTAALLLGFLMPDANHDCMITADELFNSPGLKALLTPDVCSKASCSTPDALSIGIPVQAVKATFPGAM